MGSTTCVTIKYFIAKLATFICVDKMIISEIIISEIILSIIILLTNNNL